VITADVLRRGKVATTVAGLNSADPVKCSCGVKLVPDTSLTEAMKSEYDAVVLPVSVL
jgi:protein DJ-1